MLSNLCSIPEGGTLKRSQLASYSSAHSFLCYEVNAAGEEERGKEDEQEEEEEDREEEDEGGLSDEGETDDGKAMMF